METKQYTFTRSYKKMLEDELIRRETVEADRIKAAVAEARAQGDLSENADYSAAREEQGKNQGRIDEIKAMLKNCKIVETYTVEVLYPGSNEVEKYYVCGAESDPFHNIISDQSPLYKAIENHKAGDTVSFFAGRNGKAVTVKLVTLREATQDEQNEIEKIHDEAKN